MTADTKLLPLPELPVAVERFILSSLGPMKREGAVTALRTMLREYARANVSHATAPLQAEIETLKAEVAAQRTRADAMAGEAIKHEARAERLAEALQTMVEMVEMNGFGRAYAMDVARAALDQEADRG